VPELKISIVMASLLSRRGHLTVKMLEKEDFWCQSLKLQLQIKKLVSELKIAVANQKIGVRV